MSNNELTFSHKLFNPLFWHIRDAMRDENIRYIFNRGGSSSGKSVSMAQAIILAVFNGEGSALVVRKVATSLKNTVYEEFKSQINKLCLGSFFDSKENSIVCYNGNKIDFTGLDDPEKIKSITGYRWILLEEATELEYEDFTQVRFRLRGKKGLQIICNFNPISEDSWIKTKILDTYEWDNQKTDLYEKVSNPITKKYLAKEYTSITGKRINKSKHIVNERTGEIEEYQPDTIELHSTFKNNFWVVGSPDGEYGYYDRQTIANYQWYKDHDYNYYRVYALGEWGSIKTGGEFLHAFDSNKHISKVLFNKEYPIHISVDNNVLPYISIQFHQIINKSINQFHEICAEEPFNTVTKAAELTVSYMEQIGYNDVVYIHGDSSTKSGNTIDDEKRSFLDKFISGIETSFHVEDMVPNSNPSVSMSGEFMNFILQAGMGLSFNVDDSCKHSISDYNNAKKDVNGGMLKNRIKNKLTNQTYEKYGHLTDCLRYVAVDVFKSEYTKFSLKRKRSIQTEEDMLYFNPDKQVGKRVMYVIPECNGKFISVMCMVNTHVDIIDVIYRQAFDENFLRNKIKEFNPEEDLFFECDKNFYFIVRSLREDGVSVRVLHKNTNPKNRIEANKEFIKSKVRFRSDYDTIEEYSRFVESIMDYSGDDKYESINIVSAVSYFIQKKILLFNNFVIFN